MFNVKLKSGKWLRIPETIDEMSAEQFLDFAFLLHSWETENIDVEKFKLLLLLRLANIKVSARYNFAMGEEEKNEIEANIAVLSGLMDSFFVESVQNNRLVKHINLDYTKNHLPVYKGRQNAGDIFQNMTFEEFTQASIFHSSYIKTRSEGDLNRLVAVLYLRRKRFLFIQKHWDGYDFDERKAFNAKAIEREAQKIAKLPYSFRYAAFLWFNANMQRLRVLKISIAGNEVDFSKLFSNAENNESEGIGMLGVLLDLAESGLFGNANETGKQNLYDVLIRLYQLMKRNENLKRKHVKS